MRRYLAGLGSLLALVAILVGVPVVLFVAAGNPLPTAEQLNDIFTLTPDYGNIILVTKILPLIGWIAWAFFAVPMLIEIVTSVTGRTTRELPAPFRFQQYVAAALIAAVLFMITGIGTFAGAAQPVWAGSVSGETSSGLLRPSPVSEPTAMPVAGVVAVQAEPSPIPNTQPAAAITVTYRVVPGDTLWGIAEKYYGSGTRYVDIYHASTATVQSDGSRLTDPDLIHPGWVLTVPAVIAPAAPMPAPPGPTTRDRIPPDSTAPAGSVSNPIQVPTHDPAGVGRQSSVPMPPSAREESADHGMDLSIPLMTGGGIAGLLGAGVLIELGRRRLHQRRNRTVGARIAMPEPEASDLEQRLRMIEDSPGLDHVDNALRTLQVWAEDSASVLPDLFAVRLDGGEIELYFGAPTQLAVPFTLSNDDQTVWAVRSGDVAVPIRETIAPYPALATIGVDRNDGVLLLNLEHLGSLNLVGDDIACRGFLNAIAAELASSPWADQIQMTIIGMPAELGRSLNPSRVQQGNDVGAVLRNLRHDLDDRRSAFASLGVHGIRQARAVGARSESWAPHIVLMGESIEPSAMQALGDMAKEDPDLGLVVFTHGATENGSATLSVSSEEHAELLFPGMAAPALPFTPQMLQQHELEILQELLDTTTRASKPREDATEADTAETAEPFAATPTGNLLPERPSGKGLVASGENQRVLEESAWSGWSAPYLRLLGPVDLLPVGDEAAMPGRGVELVAYLNLNDAVDGRQLQHAFWPDTVEAGNNQRQLAKKVRVALGHALDGQPLLPENSGHHGYSLHQAIRSDWDDFRARIGNNPVDAETEDLIAALRLIRGQPFANCNTRRWWHWISIPEEEIIAAVLDTVDELADRALPASDYATARFAARVAQSVDPLNEAGWRIELRIALQTGDHEGFDQILNDLYARVGGTDPDYDLDEATRQLVDRFASEKATT